MNKKVSKKTFNWMEDSSMAPGSAVYERMLWEYRSIFSESVKQILKDGRFFHACSYIPVNLYRQRGKHDSPSMRYIYFQMGAQLIYLMEEEWMEQVDTKEDSHWEGNIDKTISEEEEKVEPEGFQMSPAFEEILSPPNTVGRVLRQPERRLFDNSIRTFIGDWESLGRQISTNLREKEEWKDYASLLPDYKNHLRFSMEMVYRAVKAGNTQFARWLTDMLLKWRGHLFSPYNVSGRLLNKNLVHAGFLEEQEWEKIKPILPHLYPEEESEQKDVFNVCIENLWKDNILNLAAMLIPLIGDVKNLSANGRLAREIVQRLLHQSYHHEDAQEKLPDLQASDILSSIVRQAVINNPGSAYQKAQSRIIYTITDSLIPDDAIPGRSYSGTGVIGFDSLIYTHANILFETIMFGTENSVSSKRIMHGWRSSQNTEIAQSTDYVINQYERHFGDITGFPQKPEILMRGRSLNEIEFKKAKNFLLTTLREIREIIAKQEEQNT